MTQRARHKTNVGVGTLVKFMFGGQEVQATVVEDRGHVGAGGRHILRVRLEVAASEPIEFEVRAADVHVAA